MRQKISVQMGTEILFNICTFNDDLYKIPKNNWNRLN